MYSHLQLQATAAKALICATHSLRACKSPWQCFRAAQEQHEQRRMAHRTTHLQMVAERLALLERL